MTNYDFVQVCKLLQRENNDISNRLVQLENTYQIFHRFDELDMLDLLILKIRYSYLCEFEQKLLELLNFLIKYNSEK